MKKNKKRKSAVSDPFHLLLLEQSDELRKMRNRFQNTVNYTDAAKFQQRGEKPPRLKEGALQPAKRTFTEFTCASFTLYVALQRENIRAFLPVDVSRQTKFRDDLESPLAQSDAVVRPGAHVSPVKPLHAGRAGRAAVHLGTFYAPRSAACPLETAGRRAASSFISKRATTRSDWPHAFFSPQSPLDFEEQLRRGVTESNPPHTQTRCNTESFGFGNEMIWF